VGQTAVPNWPGCPELRPPSFQPLPSPGPRRPGLLGVRVATAQYGEAGLGARAWMGLRRSCSQASSRPLGDGPWSGPETLPKQWIGADRRYPGGSAKKWFAEIPGGAGEWLKQFFPLAGGD